MTFGKFGKQKQEAKEQLKLYPDCALSLQQMNLTNETQKSIFRRGFQAALGSIECGLAPFVPQACDLSFTCRLFV